MASLLERKLLVVTGKGGVGKTTVAARPRPARRRARTCARSSSRSESRPGCRSCSASPATQAAPRRGSRSGLWSISIDPDRALLEWLQTLGGRVSGRAARLQQHLPVLRRGGPGRQGAREHGQDLGADAGRALAPARGGYDLVVLDARPPAMRSACSTRRARSARSRASARSPDSPSRCESCSRTRTRSGYHRRRAGNRDGRHRDARADRRAATATSAASWMRSSSTASCRSASPPRSCDGSRS